MEKTYQVKAFTSCRDMEDWLNENATEYEPISIADADRYVTVLVKRIIKPS